MALKPLPKAVLLVLAAGGLFTGLRYAAGHGLLPSNIGKVLVPSKYNLPDLKEAQVANVTPVPYPSSGCASIPATLIRGEHWEWNAQAGLLLATGGNCTTNGSLMAKHGVNLSLTRQDDTNKMGQDLIACAKEIHDGAQQCSTGANFVIIMGDGVPNFVAGLNPQLLKLGPDYGLKVIGAVGYSRGEDAFMAPPQLKADPHSLASISNGATTGLLVAGVLRDGDWNIAQKWAGDNAVPNNPDESTYDKDALNWTNSADYNTAASDFVAGKCEDRKEVSRGRLTGQTVHVCINAVVTWTPGDVTVAEKKGGLVKVADSKMYRSQMPSVIVGPAHFFNQNRPEVQNLLLAAWEGADQVKAFDGALRKASEIAAKVYNDEGGTDSKGHAYSHGEYWYHYFKPVTETDASGLQVSLGGSAVANLADNQVLFGLQPGMNDNYRSVYSIFSAIDLEQYPNLFGPKSPTPLPDVKSVEDKSFITGVLLAQSNNEDQGPGAAADTVDYSRNSGQVIGKRSYAIDFASGSAEPLPAGQATLAQLKDSVAITGARIQIDGFTDNTGSAEVNTRLSQDRAGEVKRWLQQHARGNFPESRFAGVQGHGPAEPVGDNATAEGRARNRRVQITLLD
jgi:OOP family OmpA-OmpF porin